MEIDMVNKPWEEGEEEYKKPDADLKYSTALLGKYLDERLIRNMMNLGQFYGRSLVEPNAEQRNAQILANQRICQRLRVPIPTIPDVSIDLNVQSEIRWVEDNDIPW